MINIVWHFNLHAVNFHTFGHLLPPIILKYILVYVCHVTFMGCLSQKYLHYIMLMALYVIFLSILCPNVNIWYASITFVLLHKTVKTRLIHDVIYKQHILSFHCVMSDTYGDITVDITQINTHERLTTHHPHLH